jgi:aminopeptidase N
MMVFHMVERTIGGEPFGQALRDVYRDHRFQRAAWADFFAAFTAVSNRDFTAFQEQWLTRPGAPMIRLTAAERRGDDVRFNLEQDQPVYDLLVPVVITTPAGEQEREVELRTTAQAYSLTVPAASRLAIDPDYHLFRRLHPQEIEATVRQVLAEDVPLFVLPPGDEQMIAAARRFAVTFSGNETPMVVEGGHPPADVRAGSATDGVLLDPPPEVLREWLPAGVTVAGDLLFIEGLRYDLRQNDAVLAVPHPHDPGATYLIVLCRSPGRLEGLANRLGHYGKYSWLVFPAGRGQVTRGNWQPVGSPLVAELE